MASCKSCAAPSVGTLSTFLSPTCRLPQRSAKTVLFFLLLIDQIAMFFACFSAWTILWFTTQADEPHVQLKPELLSSILCMGTQPCFGLYCNGTKLSQCPCSLNVFTVVFHVLRKTQLVVILSLTNMLLIRPIIALFTRSLSLVQVPLGTKLQQGFQRWKNGLGEAWWWRMSHPSFEDWGNGRVKWGPENLENAGCFMYPFALIQTVCLGFTKKEDEKSWGKEQWSKGFWGKKERRS